MTNFNVRLRKVQDIHMIMYNTSRKILLRCDILIKITTSVHASLQGQEAQLSPSDGAMRLVSSRPNLANYHATVQKLLIRQVLTKPMV